MSNDVVLAAGLFGRLSILEAPRAEVLERIEHISESFARARRVRGVETSPSDVISSEDTFRQALPLLIRELNALLEGLVFAESLVEFDGYNRDHVGRLISKYGLAPRFNNQPVGWHYTQVWPDIANNLYDRALSGFRITSAVTADPMFLDVEFALQFPDEVKSFSSMSDVLGSNGFDYSAAGEFLADEYWGLQESADDEMSSWTKLMSFVDDSLGPDWVTYRTAVDVTASWPDHLSKPIGVDSGPQRERSVWQFKLALFLELRASLEHGSTAISNFASGEYHRLLAGRGHVAAQIRTLVSQNYERVLRQKLEELGIVWMDLLLPAVLRLCLVGADSVGDVIDNAVRLHRHHWFARLREYVAEITRSERPDKVLSQLGRLKDHIDTAHSSMTAINSASIGISSTGSFSLSLGAMGRKLSSWCNPVVFVHSKIGRTLGMRDSIGDMARVLRISRSEVIQALAKIESVA